MAKVVNTCTNVPLSKGATLLPVHIQQMNDQGWELLSVLPRISGLEELLFLFWKKTVDDRGTDSST